MNWEPIETVPLDGTKVLLWWDGDFAPVASWDGERWVYAMTQGWRNGQGGVIEDCLFGYEPTHWAPTPEVA